MKDTDDATLIAQTLEHDRKATGGPWSACPGGVYSTIAAQVLDQNDHQTIRTLDGDLEEGGIGAVSLTRGKYELEMDNAHAIAAYRTAAPEPARRLAERNRQLKMARYDHVSDKALDSQRAMYEAIQEEIEAHDNRWGSYVDDAIKDIDQLRKERDEARRIARELYGNTGAAVLFPPDWLVKP